MLIECHAPYEQIRDKKGFTVLSGLTGPSGDQCSMNAANFLSGIAVILVGACLFFVGPQLIMVQSTQVQVTELFHDETLAVSEVGERSAQLDEGVTVNGTVAASSALTGGPSDVQMLVADDENYQKWVTGGSPTYTFQKDMLGGQNFSFTVPRTGLYHFVFDNRNSPVKKKVTMTADLQKQVTISMSDKRILYVAYGVIAVGSLITVVGILRRTPVRWA